VLEGLVLRPGRPPPIIEVDQKPSVLPVDAARHQRLQHVSPEGCPGLLSDVRIRHDLANRSSTTARLITCDPYCTLDACASPKPAEEEWNHHDTLTEKTKLLHNTEIPTQPWKTGLPADYHEHASQVQEQLFFALLKECLEQGRITRRFLRKAVRKNYLRKDAFALLRGLPSAPPGPPDRSSARRRLRIWRRAG
jgi:hypothetical protein